ncbi:hypothetical protein PBI_ASTRAEA_60 [Mycobacterium phage Astraea]|uniref:Uncharacterized protein n=2 Tax=Bixzunavirus TaxID=680114 RepID=R4TCP9_9CAUD|nr:hypothetical protein M182_gp061 [Mycobacterium phage Astraea]AGM13025.1 hypothetical protein PBI_ASTRAEA_60 [Mycobacterium phage Astraea]AXN53890.1 hypothetical protein SEA_RABINOVISH_58 [Mycobacterium phage Rabinovish]QAX93364.1 hypothetical protein SEA_STUBBY_54 [Mycobacterium phage Stubby]UEM46117.1 hypothetical protein SEA_PINKCREEK_51 [Mycobacterium phage Pinkcreek]
MSKPPLRYITADGVLWYPVSAGHGGSMAFARVSDVDAGLGPGYLSLNEVLRQHGALEIYDPIVKTAKVLVAAAEETGRKLDQWLAEDIVAGLDVLGWKVVKVTEDTPE